jgi:hypothetical protein
LPFFICFTILCTVGGAWAEDIEGVQPAAMDQPRINAVMKLQANGQPLIGNVGGEKAFNVEAFLDTGASGVMLSTHTAELLGIHKSSLAGKDVIFEDVGVGGSDRFNVSDQAFVSLAAYAPNVNVEDVDAIATTYGQTVGPLRLQIGPQGIEANLLSSLMGDLDVLGMPVMQGKIVVLDVKPVNTFSDKIRTTVYDARDAATAGRVPKVKRHVKLSSVSFAVFTKTTPAGAQPPTLCANPVIGPDPLDAAKGKQVPPITAGHHGKTVAGTWLLDTGAAASMISRKEAAALGVTYAAGSWGTDSPVLEGVPRDQQFTMTVGGIGGSKKSAGFYLDSLRLETAEGEPLIYKKAPVLVSDITVMDPTTKKEFTLDGVFGMNFLTASAKLTEGLLPDIDKMTPGAFETVIFDQPAGVLGLQ